MNSDIVISNPADFEEKKKILEAGADKLHVISDFDRTLTKAFVNGQKTPSVISVLRSSDYVSSEYAEKANELAEKYHTIEMDPNIGLEEKKKAMQEWWTKHFDLLIKSGLKKDHIKQVVDSGKIKFREGALGFLDFLHENSIPLVIMSSAGLGGDSIRMMLEKENRMYNNIHIVSNAFEWDSEGRAVGVKKPIIHVLNKKEVSVKGLSVYGDLLKRKNVLLLGDGLGDVDMIEGFDYDNLIKIGFLNYEIDKFLESFKGVYDVLILNDGKMDFVNDLVRDIK